MWNNVEFPPILTMVVVAVSGLFFSAELLYIFRRLPIHDLYLDAPNFRKVHQRLVPRMGHLGILFSVLAALLFYHFNPTYFPHIPASLRWCLGISVVTMLVFSVFDDSCIIQRFLQTSSTQLRREMPVKLKFIMQFALAIGTIQLLTPLPDQFVFMGITWATPAWATAVLVVWIVGVMNAYNIIDGIDSLLGTVSLVSFCAIAILAGFAGLPEISILATLVAGALVGFLFHNSSPAFVFMGDAGSLFIGYLVAIFSIYILGAAPIPTDISILFYVAGIPVLDIWVAMYRRFTGARKKSVKARLKNMVAPDNNHMHHRLLFHGFNHNQSSFLLSGVQVFFALAALSVAAGVSVFVIHGYMVAVITILLFTLYSKQSFYVFTDHLRELSKLMSQEFFIGLSSPRSLLIGALQKERRHTFRVEEVNPRSAAPMMAYDAFIIEENHTAGKQAIDDLLLTIHQKLPHTPIVLIVPNPKELGESHIMEAIKNGPGLTLVKYPFYTPMVMMNVLKLIRNNSYKPISVLPPRSTKSLPILNGNWQPTGKLDTIHS
jgi:UDP-GlcNAc:undecaprenyl-phosphate/decaprenyl-phosphate GlcNAc-1-phosphate transferase